MIVSVKYVRLERGEGLLVPSRQSIGASGFDLRSAVNTVVQPRYRVAVPTGFAFEIPKGWEGQVRPRSGLSRDYGITVLNSPGTIDADYRGEVMVILYNTGDIPFAISRGDRVAQLVFAPVQSVTLVPVEALSETDRGSGGFGSTGR